MKLLENFQMGIKIVLRQSKKNHRKSVRFFEKLNYNEKDEKTSAKVIVLPK